MIKFAALGLVVATCLGAQTPSGDLDSEAKRRAEFVAYLTRTNPAYPQIALSQRSQIRSLRNQVRQRESTGRDTSCSQQILAEIDWLADTVDLPTAARRIHDLESVLAHPEEEPKAAQQDPADGGWGRCHNEWFFKVNATFDHITNPANRKEQPPVPIHLFDRINSPDKLRQYFASVAVSDIPNTGRDNLRELNESLENLSRLILHNRPPYYHWDPRLKDAMLDIIANQLRNPETGWWGPRYVRDGKVQFVNTLSMTFHMVTTLEGQVSSLDKAMAHLLAVKDQDYPIGWLRSGRYSNHHLMDVVSLFRYGWPSMSAAQRESAAAEIHNAVRWCLDQSLQPDGSFHLEEGGDSLEEETNYGATLLADAGVFDRSKRFWTTEDFPGSDDIRARIIAFIQSHLKSGGAGGTYYRHALEELMPASDGR